MPPIHWVPIAASACLAKCLTALLFGFFSASVLAQVPVTLQLKWTHGFQFAGDRKSVV